MPSEKSVKKEWNEAVEPWVDFVRQGKDYYRDELNNPATFRLIGNVTGQLVLDLACGEGFNTRILAKKGAKEVIGVDFSEKMIELARRDEARETLGIQYYVADAANLREFPNTHFDLVACFMSLQDIKNYEKAISEVARILRKGGRFVFSVPHPCFETWVAKGRRITIATRYYGRVKYTVQWDMKRLVKPFRTTSFHRTLTDYFDTLCRDKLHVLRLVEPRPTKKGLKEHPPLRQVLMKPQSIIIEAIKVS
jgi:ubiquinone/menaquinone biosynthesis C-methylase UbiE